MNIIAAFIWASSIALAAPAPICHNITDIAGGGLPNIEAPPFLSQNTVLGLQIANFLENLEAFFFVDGLKNITTWGINGYPNDTIEVVGKIAAQEIIHITTIVNLLNTIGAAAIPPCKYGFPVTSTKEFLALGNTITSVGIGATIGLSESIAATDPALIKSLSSIITVESRHDAFFRISDGKAPNPTPFDTGISGIWAYNLALSFVVPGSCTVEPPVPILPTLSVSPPSGPRFTNTSTIEFAWDPKQTPISFEASKQLFIGWVNQLNVPTYTKLTPTGEGKGRANMPFGLEGVAFAVLTSQRPDDINDLTSTTLAGPVILPIS
ncbi:MAG: hypothetical protein M1840_008279 [Geoglossum simile]|nr:MAG: hypothetical protein M1840_008279 [Geoglossum simile]